MPPIAGLFAYVGPDTFLPVSSVLAGVAGVVMMFGRTGLRLILRGRVARALSGRAGALSGPHRARHRQQAIGAANPAELARGDG